MYTSHLPSGEMSGSEWYFSLYVNSQACPVSGKTFQIDPLIATAIHSPSGDQSGAHGVELGAGGK